VKEGDELEVMPPLGRFVPRLDPQAQKNYIFFSGGSGITPVFSILRTVLIKEPFCTCTLFYGNKNTESIIFHSELKEIKDTYGDRFRLYHTIDQYADNWEGYSGMIDRAKATYFINTYCHDIYAHAQYFICGPTAMMHEVEAALRDKLVPKENVHIERFTSDLSAVEEHKKETAAAIAEEATFDASQGFKAKVILDGNETEIEIKEGQTVLEAGIDAGLDPPFACQIAACATCRAKLREGKVIMDEREALTDDEIEDGYVLTCQSHPVTNYIVVDYDA
jgi:ring-1,2-phenylacetyl-CoA epoxidase subunit PaaE